MHFTWQIKIRVHLKYGCILHGEIAICKAWYIYTTSESLTEADILLG